MTGQESPIRTSRLHVGGKLSFRRRVPKLPDDAPAGLPYREFSENPPPLAELVPPGFDRVEIEIGPGKGTFLLAAAAARPDTFILGIEAAPGYARYAAERLLGNEHHNAMVLVDNGALFLRDSVEPGALHRLHVYFPDPWPKRRHKKRRFFNPDMPAVVHRALEPDGLLLVATDNAAYAGQICSVLGSSPLFRRDSDEEQRLIAQPGHGFGPTNFERKYLKEHRVIRRYAYRRVED